MIPQDTQSIIFNLFHLLIFVAANGFFVYAVYTRLRLISKGQKAHPLAPLEARIRSVLLNVVFQFKLFKHPVRGLMHAFIFYGFLVYAIHTTSQMLAGNAWLFFQQAGVSPYDFRLTDYIYFGFRIAAPQALSALLLLLGTISLTALAMHNFRHKKLLGKRKNWRNTPWIQWIFLSLMSVQFLGFFFVVFASGTYFYESIIQHFSLLVLLSLSYFGYRRWLLRAKGLDVPSSQSAIVLLLIGTLMLSTLIGATAQHALDTHGTWITATLLPLLQGLGMQDSTTVALRDFSWWLHIATVYTFMIYVPISKHSHLIFAPINYFLARRRPFGQMNLMDFESEEGVFGASNVRELHWSSLLDSLSCIECGRCTIECPANRTGKPLDPKKIMVDVKHSLIENMTKLQAAKEGEEPASIIGEPYITEEELWGCTSCHACVESCPVGNNQLDAIMELRRNLVLNESRFPSELQTAFNNMEKQANPWGISAESRADWCADLNVKTMAESSNVDILYWVGCAAAFDERNKKIARSFVSILQKADVNFAILGKEESCTGDSARRGGNEYLYQTLAQQNIETLNNYNVKKIVTACPHCFNTLKNEYPQLGGNYEVYHHSDYIDDLIEQDKVKVDPQKVADNKERRASFHDSCYLGRYNEIFNEPRRLTERAFGNAIAEPVDTKRNSLCCGAGGAQMWMEEKYDRVNMKRTEQLVDTGADTIATACPFCITMISDGVKTKELVQDVNVLDVAEIIDASLEGSTATLPKGFSSESSSDAPKGQAALTH